MPSKNSRKIDVDESFYHIYNRGVNKQNIFVEDKDYNVFLNLIKRYLSDGPQKDSCGREYPNYSLDIELLAFCLMPNHYHLLVYQQKEGAMAKLLQAVGAAYTVFFNKKYERVGHLFQDRFKASMITNDPYLMHISRYIHLNPETGDWEYSSLPYYLGNQNAEWLKPGRITELFKGKSDYRMFLNDYSGYKKSLELIAEKDEIL